MTPTQRAAMEDARNAFRRAACAINCSDTLWLFEQVDGALRAALAAPDEYTVTSNGKKSSVLTAMMNNRTKREAALAEAEEPVAWAYINSDGECEEIEYGRYSEADDSCITHLYAHPPRREPLTMEQLKEIIERERAMSSDE